jgi:hypothetical protein
MFGDKCKLQKHSLIFNNDTVNILQKPISTYVVSNQNVISSRMTERKLYFYQNISQAEISSYVDINVLPYILDINFKVRSIFSDKKS